MNQRLHQHRIPVWQEEHADRAPWVFATQENVIHRIRTHYLWKQDHSTKGDAPVHPWRPPRQGMLSPKGKEYNLLAQNHLWHPTTHRKVYDLSGIQQVTANHRNYPRGTTVSMAYTGNRFILLEKNGLSHSHRCLLKVHHSEETAKFNICSHAVSYTHLTLPTNREV